MVKFYHDYRKKQEFHTMVNSRYNHALSYLSKFNGRTMNRKNGFHHQIMRDLLELFSIHLSEFQFIQITGSCGKGSTAHFISAILTQHSYPHGLFTGPHLTHYEERFSHNGKRIDREDFITLVEVVENKLSNYEFEQYVAHMHIMIVIALLYFKQQGLQLIVFENGVGGKTDPSNVIDPLIAVFTEITMDHSHLLGATIEDIIIDKSCIIKESTQYAICGMNNVQARNYLLKLEALDETKFHFINRDYGFIMKQSDKNGSIFYYKGNYFLIEKQQLQMLGTHQIQNASNALAVSEALIEMGYSFDKEKIMHALRHVQSSCRMELLEIEGQQFLFDGAHNSLELKTLKENIDSLNMPISIVIMSISSNKEISTMLRSIEIPNAIYVFTPHPFLERNSSSEDIHHTLRSIGKTNYIFLDNIADVFDYVFHQTQRTGIVLVTGSLYLVGYVKDYFIEHTT